MILAIVAVILIIESRNLLIGESATGKSRAFINRKW
jgi:hypothetical protein